MDSRRFVMDKIKLWLSKAFYPLAIYWWSKWSKVYRYFFLRKYSDVTLKKDLSYTVVTEELKKLKWTKDGFKALGDACGTPQWTQHCLNEVGEGNDQPSGYLDCDDFSVWACNVTSQQFFPRMFAFAWQQDGKIKGHVMCLVRRKDGKLHHTGNWGLYGPHTSLRSACEEIIKVKNASGAVGWALLGKDLKVIRTGRGLPNNTIM